MTTIWPNSFGGGVDWRLLGGGLLQTESAVGLGPEASGDTAATDAESPAVVITTAPPFTSVTYTPPNGLALDPMDEMDLETYFRLIGYDPAAIEERNANGYYRSVHDDFEANGGPLWQAEAAWRRSGLWAQERGFDDVGREAFINNYIDNAYGVDPEMSSDRNNANVAQYLSVLQGTLNAAWSNLQSSNDDDTRRLNRQTFDDLVSRIESVGINIRGIMNGSASGQSWREAADPSTEHILISQRISGFVLELPGGLNPSQTSGMDGFQTIGNTPYFSVPINNPALAQLGIESFEVSRNTVTHIYNRHFSGLPGQSQFEQGLKSENALVSYVVAPVLQNAYALDIRTNSKDSRGAIMINVYGNLPFTAGTDRNGTSTKSVMVSMRWVPGSQSAQVTTAFPVTQGGGN